MKAYTIPFHQYATQANNAGRKMQDLLDMQERIAKEEGVTLIRGEGASYDTVEVRGPSEAQSRFSQRFTEEWMKS